jgi:hypothetical protein
MIVGIYALARRAPQVVAAHPELAAGQNAVRKSGRATSR